jgi:hypothetical protein
MGLNQSLDLGLLRRAQKALLIGLAAAGLADQAFAAKRWQILMTTPASAQADLSAVSS